MTRPAEPQGAVYASRSVSVADRRRIVASKLAAPAVRRGIVDRPALLDGLVSAIHVPVVLVSAPTGYGKTTLLALWRERDERPFAWVSLDAADDDPVALVASVIAALDPLLDLDPLIGDALDAPEPALEESMLPSLVGVCAEGGQPFVLVLDDVHLVTETRCHAAIGYLAERLPPGCQLALGTRTDSPLPLGSWRAYGRLVELRVAELSLACSEAGAVLAAGVRLPDDRLAQLVERTEGWAAGVYLAALSLRDRADPEEFVVRFAGISRHNADILSEDVLARQTEDAIGFLLGTCVLEQFTASLCDALAGGIDADAMLRQLERSNLFVVPLDEARMPIVITICPRSTCAPSSRVESRSSYRSCIVAHGDGFDDAQIKGHAPLAIAAAWAAALGRHRRAAHLIDALRRGSWEALMPDGTASLESAIAVTSAAFGIEGISRMCTVTQRAVDLEPAANRQRAVALEILGAALTLQEELARCLLACAAGSDRPARGRCGLGPRPRAARARGRPTAADARRPGERRHLQRGRPSPEPARRPGGRRRGGRACERAAASADRGLLVVDDRDAHPAGARAARARRGDEARRDTGMSRLDPICNRQALQNDYQSVSTIRTCAKHGLSASILRVLVTVSSSPLTGDAARPGPARRRWWSSKQPTQRRGEP